MIIVIGASRLPVREVAFRLGSSIIKTASLKKGMFSSSRSIRLESSTIAILMSLGASAFVRPVKLQRSSPAYSLPARLSLLHLDTGGILAGRLVSSLSHGHGPHLDFGHPDPQQTPGYSTAPQPAGLDARTGAGA